MKSERAKRNDVQINVNQNGTTELFRYIKKVDGANNIATECCDQPVENFSNYFIIAADNSGTIVAHQRIIQPVDQLQLLFLRPIADGEILKHNSTSKNKISVGLDC